MAEDALQAQATLAARREARTRLERYGRMIGTVDGSNRDEVRAWLDKVDHAKEWTSASDAELLEMVGYLMAGPLANHVRRFVKDNAPAVIWDQVKKSITETFLDQHEGRALRQQVERLKQKPFEDPREFGIRFLEAVQQAYTTDDLKLDAIQQALMDRFLRGLRNLAVRRQVYLSSPTTLKGAIDLATKTAGAFGLADEESSREEPMEIGAVGETTTYPRGSEIMDCVTSLRKEIEKLRDEMKEPSMAGRGHGRPPSAGPGRSSNWRGRGRGRGHGATGPRDSPTLCYRCGEPGHFRRECEKIQRDRLQRMEATVAALQASVDQGTGN